MLPGFLGFLRVPGTRTHVFLRPFWGTWRRRPRIFPPCVYYPPCSRSVDARPPSTSKPHPQYLPSFSPHDEGFTQHRTAWGCGNPAAAQRSGQVSSEESDDRAVLPCVAKCAAVLPRRDMWGVSKEGRRFPPRVPAHASHHYPSGHDGGNTTHCVFADSVFILSSSFFPTHGGTVGVVAPSSVFLSCLCSLPGYTFPLYGTPKGGEG